MRVDLVLPAPTPGALAAIIAGADLFEADSGLPPASSNRSPASDEWPRWLGMGLAMAGLAAVLIVVVRRLRRPAATAQSAVGRSVLDYDYRRVQLAESE